MKIMVHVSIVFLGCFLGFAFATVPNDTLPQDEEEPFNRLVVYFLHPVAVKLLVNNQYISNMLRFSKRHRRMAVKLCLVNIFHS